MDDNEIIAAWIRYHQKEHKKNDDPDFDAYIELGYLVEEDTRHALRIMDGIVAATDDKMILANLGAGPLEDLLKLPENSKLVGEIFERARKNKNWQHVLGCMWTYSIKDPGLANEIEREIKKYYPKGRP